MDIRKKDEVQEGEIVSVVENRILGKSQGPYDEHIIGVISGKRTTTLHLGNSESNSPELIRLPVALAGLAYVKVCAEAGPINLGEPITSSSLAGIGMRAVRAGKILGYALEEEDFSKGKLKEVLVFIKLGEWVPREEYAQLMRELDLLEEEYLALAQEKHND